MPGECKANSSGQTYISGADNRNAHLDLGARSRLIRSTGNVVSYPIPFSSTAIRLPPICKKSHTARGAFLVVQQFTQPYHDSRDTLQTEPHPIYEAIN